MAWLQDNGDENEYSQMEEDEGGERDEGLLEETEEEVTIVERPGVPAAPAPSAPKPKPRKPGAAKAKAKAKKTPQAGAKSAAQEARCGQELQEEGIPQELNAQEEALNFARQSRRPAQGEVCLAV